MKITEENKLIKEKNKAGNINNQSKKKRFADFEKSVPSLSLPVSASLMTKGDGGRYTEDLLTCRRYK